jgi:hypothetical protein
MIMYGGPGTDIWHVSWAGLQFAKLHAKKQPGQTQVKITKVQAWTDQRPTNHASRSRIIKCPSKTRLFQSLAIKQLTLDSEFKAVNALVIDHRMLRRLEMSPRFPCGTGGSLSFPPLEY